MSLGRNPFESSVNMANGLFSASKRNTKHRDLKETWLWSLLIMNYFAFNCCGWPCLSIWCSKGHRSEQHFAMHGELYWLDIKIKNQLTTPTDPFGTDFHFLKQCLINALVESAGLNENNPKLHHILIGKWIDRSIDINNRLEMSPMLGSGYERAPFFDDIAKILGCRQHSLNNTWTPRIWDIFSPMCNVLHISGNEATLESVICWWECIPVVHGLGCRDLR